MNRYWGPDNRRRHRKAVRHERSEGWRLLKAWAQHRQREIITRVLGAVGLFMVWGGLLLIAKAAGWPGGTLVLVGVVCSIAWMYLYISEMRDPR